MKKIIIKKIIVLLPNETLTFLDVTEFEVTTVHGEYVLIIKYINDGSECAVVLRRDMVIGWSLEK